MLTVIYFLFHLSLALLLRYRCKIVFSHEDGTPFPRRVLEELGIQAEYPPLYFIYNIDFDHTGLSPSMVTFSNKYCCRSNLSISWLCAIRSPLLSTLG